MEGTEGASTHHLVDQVHLQRRAGTSLLAPATLVSMSTSGARRVVKQLHISLTLILAVCHEPVLPCPPSFDVWYVPSLYVLLQTYHLHIIGNLSTRGAAYTVLPGRELTVLSQE